MLIKYQEDIELTLEERLEEQRRKYRNYSNKAVEEAIKAFDEVYNAKDENEKLA